MTQRTQSQSETVDFWAFIEGAIGFISDVAHDGTRLILSLEGRDVGAVVSMSDLQKLQNNDEQKGGADGEDSQ